MYRKHLRRGPIATTLWVVCALCATASVAYAATTSGRRPPAGGLHFQGVFHRALWGGDITIDTSKDGMAVVRVQGMLPGTCRDRRDGRVKRAGTDGAIGLQFDVEARAAGIHANGSFRFTAKNASGEELDAATLIVRGTFYGNNILGRVTGRTTGHPSTYSRYSSCTGDQQFWARRNDRA